jgi:hypothetical protein
MAMALGQAPLSLATRNGTRWTSTIRVEYRRRTKRRVCKMTAAGTKTLESAKAMVDELHHELREDRPREIAKRI